MKPGDLCVSRSGAVFIFLRDFHDDLGAFLNTWGQRVALQKSFMEVISEAG